MAQLKEYKLYRFYAFVQLRFLGSMTKGEKTLGRLERPT